MYKYAKKYVNVKAIFVKSERMYRVYICTKCDRPKAILC